jgi:hypothetical protein
MLGEKWTLNMLANYYWQLEREVPDTHRRKSNGKRLLTH